MERSQKKSLVATVVTVNLLAFTDGFMVSWASPVTAKLRTNGDDNPFHEALSVLQISWIGSILSLGSMCGPAIFSYSSVKIGRKWTLFSIAIPFILSLITLAFAESVVLYYVARFIGGLSVGGTVMMIPVYLAEISNKKIRGAVGSSIKAFTVTGSFLPYVIGPYVSIMWFNLILVIPSTLFVIFFMFNVPETPQYLIRTGREDEARMVIGKYLSTDVQESFEEIKDIVETDKSIPFKDAFRNRYNLIALLISIGAFVLMRLCGSNVIISYTEGILDEADTPLDADVAAIIVGGVQVLATLVTPFFIDRYGRRLFLVISASGMVVMDTILGSYFFVDGIEGARWLPIFCLVFHMFSYCLGVASIPPILMAELLPTKVKANASALVVTIGSAFSFIITQTFPNIAEHVGMYGAFWFFAASNIVMIFYAIFIIPETKGKSFKELESILIK